MIRIPSVQTNRFSVEMKELSIRAAINMASIPDDMLEESHAYLIKSSIKDIKNISVEDLTVQERIFLVSHYIAATQDDPNFIIGAGAYVDYLQVEKQYSEDVIYVGEYEEDQWSVGHFYAKAADTIEKLMGEIDGLTGVAHWEVGRMAAQLIANNDSLNIHSATYEKDLLERMKVYAEFPESAFINCQVLLQVGLSQLSHLFDISVDSQGIVVIARDDLKDESGGAISLPNARFPASTVITSVAKNLCGKSD